MSRADAAPAETDPPRSPTGWRPRSLTVGQDPDPRFTLANERTFLAWMRTSMGLTAGAVGLEAFAADTFGSTLRLILVLGLLAGAAVLAVFAFARWLAVEAAMRRGRSLPFPGTAVVLVAVAGGVALAVLLVVALR